MIMLSPGCAGALLAGAYAALALSSPAYADTSHDLAVCAALDNSIERLQCFDGLAKQLGVDAPATSSETVSAWDVIVKTSPVDDSQNVYLRVVSSEAVANRYGGVSRPSLMVRCQENKTNLYTVWSDYLGNEDIELTIRIDKDPAYSRDWSISTDGNAAGLWNGGNSIPFIQSLFGRDQLLVRLTPYAESAVTAIFPISGLEQAIEPLRKACGW